MKLIQDTREKRNSYFFASYDDVELTIACLKTGDYSLVGYENKITIDRKHSSGELQMCFGPQWKRFYKELERMASFEEAYIMCAFPYEYLSIFPEKSEIPKYRWKYIRMKGSFLKKRVFDIEEEFPVIKFVFNDSNSDAEHQTYKILRSYHDRKNNTEQEV